MKKLRHFNTKVTIVIVFVIGICLCFKNIYANYENLNIMPTSEEQSILKSYIKQHNYFLRDETKAEGVLWEQKYYWQYGLSGIDLQAKIPFKDVYINKHFFLFKTACKILQSDISIYRIYDLDIYPSKAYIVALRESNRIFELYRETPNFTEFKSLLNDIPSEISSKKSFYELCLFFINNVNSPYHTIVLNSYRDIEIIAPSITNDLTFNMRHEAITLRLKKRMKNFMLIKKLCRLINPPYIACINDGFYIVCFYTFSYNSFEIVFWQFSGTRDKIFTECHRKIYQIPGAML